uniref:Uncharacterized protein n=1 Tax=Solanum tuberosum TaxID=4113 RepID=M1DAH6_SOLTU
MDGLEFHVKNQLQVADSMNTKELKTQLANMRDKLSKLAQKLVTMPPPFVPESFMSLFSEPPVTQYLDNFWGEVPQHKYSKRKHKAGEYNEELTSDLSKEKRRQSKKARKESRKKSKAVEALAQQRRDAVLAGAFGSGVLVTVSGSQPHQEQVSESAPVDKGVDAHPTTGT